MIPAKTARRGAVLRAFSALALPALPALLLPLALAGCSPPSSLDPVDWWHDLRGGRIAESRPAPPNSTAPYPSLSTVPNRPATEDTAVRRRIADALVADRANAQYGASLAPLPTGPIGQRTAIAPAAPAEMSASMPAAAAPLPPPTPPRPAPRTAVDTAPLAPPPAPTSAPAPGAPTPAADAASTAIPGMPAQPPAPPVLPGVPGYTRPVPPPATPPPPPIPPAPLVAGAPLAVPFAAESAVLSPEIRAQLRTLAGQRGAASIAVTGYGDSPSSDPAAQSAVLPLAWQRARAIASALEAAGVPASQLRLAAQANGRGGAAAIAP